MCLCVCVSVCLLVSVSFCLCIGHCDCLCVCQCDCLSVCLCACLIVCPSVCLSVCLPVFLPRVLSIFYFFFFPSVQLSHCLSRCWRECLYVSVCVFLSIWVSLCLSVCLWRFADWLELLLAVISSLNKDHNLQILGEKILHFYQKSVWHLTYYWYVNDSIATLFGFFVTSGTVALGRCHLRKTFYFTFFRFLLTI